MERLAGKLPDPDAPGAVVIELVATIDVDCCARLDVVEPDKLVLGMDRDDVPEAVGLGLVPATRDVLGVVTLLPNLRPMQRYSTDCWTQRMIPKHS